MLYKIPLYYILLQAKSVSPVEISFEMVKELTAFVALLITFYFIFKYFSQQLQTQNNKIDELDNKIIDIVEKQFTTNTNMTEQIRRQNDLLEKVLQKLEK